MDKQVDSIRRPVLRCAHLHDLPHPPHHHERSAGQGDKLQFPHLAAAVRFRSGAGSSNAVIHRRRLPHHCI